MAVQDVEMRLARAEDFSLDAWDQMLVRVGEDLRESGIEFRVEAPTAPAPDGAKSGLEAWIPATLLVSSTPFMFRTFSACIETWLKNRIVRSVRLKIGENELELTHVTADQQDAILQLLRDSSHVHE